MPYICQIGIIHDMSQLIIECIYDKELNLFQTHLNVTVLDNLIIIHDLSHYKSYVHTKYSYLLIRILMSRINFTKNVNTILDVGKLL